MTYLKNCQTVAKSVEIAEAANGKVVRSNLLDQPEGI